MLKTLDSFAEIYYKSLDFCRALLYTYLAVRRCGGIGRRAGLKIPW